MGSISIVMDAVDYIALLDDRKKQVEVSFNWTCNDDVWDLFTDYIGQMASVSQADPKKVVDNFLVNGVHGAIKDWKRYRHCGETKKEFLDRCFAYNDKAFILTC